MTGGNLLSVINLPINGIFNINLDFVFVSHYILNYGYLQKRLLCKL